MATARKNVTEISQFARARGKNGGTVRSPLDDCREISALRLFEALNEGLEQAVGQLLGMADKAAGLEVYHLYMDAMELARDRAEPIAESFREHYLWHFNRECRRDGGRHADGLNAELSLLEPDDLEESLAAGTLANAIFNACSEELFGLGKRIGLLINDPDLVHGDNPLGPEAIGMALMEALDEQESPIKVRLLLVSLLSRHLPEQVRDIYREINRKLVERNVLPTIRVGMKRQAALPQGGSATAAEAGEQAAAGGDLFSVLQRLMGGGMAPAAGPFVAGPAMPGQPMTAALRPGEAAADLSGALLRPGTFMYALNQLQHGHAEGAALAGLDVAALGNGQVNVLRGLRGGGMAGMMNPLDAMTLDIVAMVFDYILGDDRIPDAIKALIGRLQIPMLKVAMLDKGFFSQKNHPARRLLDALAEAAIGWDPQEGHEGGLYRKIEQLVAGVLEHFEDNFEVFDTAQAELRAWLDEERRAADRVAARSALAVRSREQADLGQQAAHDEVESSLLGRPVPGVIRSFLNEHWASLLADLYLKVGSDNETWKGAVATMNDLIWSVGPKVDADQRKRLVGMLPGLLKRLDEGTRYLGLSESIRDGFFSSLVRCHAEAVKAGQLDEDEAVHEVAADDDFPVLDQAADFEPVEPLAEAEVAALEEVSEVGADAPEAMALQALDWHQDGRPASDMALARLKRGSWIAYLQDDGTEVRAKLSWISPLKGIYLFTNRQGQRAMSINADGLAAKLAAGEVRLLDAAPLMDRAVDSLMEQLQRNAA